MVGDRPVQVQANRTANPDYERNMAAHAATLGFDAFIDRIVSPGAGNDTYLTAYNSAANAEALSALNADLGFLDAYLTRDAQAPHGMMWIGPAGTFTPLHHDLTNNLLVQLVGRKVVLMAAPGETRSSITTITSTARSRPRGARRPGPLSETRRRPRPPRGAHARRRAVHPARLVAPGHGARFQRDRHPHTTSGGRTTSTRTIRRAPRSSTGRMKIRGVGPCGLGAPSSLKWI